MKNFQPHKIIWHTCHSLAFLSTLPISRWLQPTDDFADSAYTFPLAAMLLALPSACFLLLANVFAIDPLVNSLLTILILIFTTGALHEDGLADTTDGFFGGKNTQEKLAIMKDSNIGSYGTLALVFSLLARIVLLWQIILQLNIIATIFVFVSIAAISRTAMLWLWISHNIAENANENNSLTQLFEKPNNESLIMAVIFCLPIIFILLISCGLIATTLACGFATLVTFAFGKLCQQHIGGIRGDSLGAVQQLCEVALYLSLVAFL